MTQHSAETVATPEKEGNVLFNDALNQHLKKLKQTAEPCNRTKTNHIKINSVSENCDGSQKIYLGKQSVAKLKNIFDIT